MVTTGLPIPTAAPAQAATPAAAAAGAGADFVEMLAQMITGSADTPLRAPEGTVATDDTSKDKSDPTAQDGQQLAPPGMLPFQLFNQVPIPAVPAQPMVPAHDAGAAQLSAESVVSEVTAVAIETLTEPRSSRPGASDSQPDKPTAATPDAGQLAALTPIKFEQLIPVTAQVHAPVGSQHWPDQLGAQLTMIAHRGEHVAALKLSPEHLGPLEVRITTQDDKTTVWFGATHAETRAALEQALPRLRELFAAQGMNLTDAGVHREPPRDNSRVFVARSKDDTAAGDTAVAGSAAVTRVGLLDAYA